MERTVGRGRAPVALLLAASLLVLSAGGAAAAGKPGYPDRITWNGATWSVKTSRSPVGPGPCRYEKTNVSVDAQGVLHLRIARNGSGAWTCAEIIGPTSHGYGTYTFELASAVHALDPQVVLGMFTWSDKAPYAHREIDIEIAKWGNAGDPTNAQYVVQPWDRADHLHRFSQPADPSTTHQFTWRAGTITWRSLDASGVPFAAYTYTGSDVPKPGDERVRLNLWLFQGLAPTDGQPVDVAIRSFRYTP